MQTKNIPPIIKEAWLDCVMDGLVPEDEPVKLFHSPKHKSACWAFINNCHHIVVGDRFLDLARSKDVHADVYLRLLRHELSHARYTERDMPLLVEKLKELNVPFGLLNRFEDIRIEKTDAAEYNAPYEWDKYITESELIKSKISKGGELTVYDELCLMQNADGCADGMSEDAVNYYQRLIECEDSFAVAQVCADFLDQFPEQRTNPEFDEDSDLFFFLGDGDGESGDDGVSEESIKEALDEILENCTPLVGGDSDESDGSGSNDDGGDGEGGKNQDGDNHGLAANKVPEYHNYEWCDEPTDVDHDSAVMVFEALKPLMVSPSALVSTSTPSKRLNMRGLMAGHYDLPYRMRTQEVSQNKKVNLIIDTSGSMSYSASHPFPIDNARIVAHAFSMLAEAGVIHGKLILSGSGFRAGENPCFDLREARHVIPLISADCGGECFADAIAKNTGVLADADVNFIFTDGCISDGDVDKSELNRRGIYLFGLYVGEWEEANERLNRWFHAGVARDNLNDLLAAVTGLAGLWR